MKLIIPTNEKDLNDDVCLSFGRTPYFAIYDTAINTTEFIENTAANSTGGAGIKAAQIVVDNCADILITPRLGENAANVLLATEIKIYKSVAGTVQQNINAFIAQELSILNKFHAGFHGIGGN